MHSVLKGVKCAHCEKLTMSKLCSKALWDQHLRPKAWASLLTKSSWLKNLNVEVLRKRVYVKMPPVEETLESYLSQGNSSSLKAPILLSKPLGTTSPLNSRAYAQAGQAGGSLHTMAML